MKTTQMIGAVSTGGKKRLYDKPFTEVIQLGHKSPLLNASLTQYEPSPFNEPFDSFTM